MDPQIKNFAEVEKFIRENPAQADKRARGWYEFANRYPEASQFENLAQLLRFGQGQHINAEELETIWLGREITAAYIYLRSQHEDRQMQQDGVIDRTDVPTALLASPFLALIFRTQPRLMEEDPDYQKIIEQKKKEWLKASGRKNFNSKEGLDYLYSSLDDDTAPSLDKEAEKTFRENEKFTKKVERYDREKRKIYKNLQHDPAIKWQTRTIEEETAARYELLRGSDRSIKRDDVRKRVEGKAWERFVERHPDKTEMYAKQKIHENLIKAYRGYTIKQAQQQFPGYEATAAKQARFIFKQTFEKPSPMRVPAPPIRARPAPIGWPNRLPNVPFDMSRLRGTLQAGVKTLGSLSSPFLIIGVALTIGIFTFILSIAGQNLTGQTPTTEAGSFVPGSVRPPSDNFATLQKNLKNTETGYGMDFVGFDNPTLYYNYLAWAWEKLEEVKHTKFLELVKKGNTNTVLTITKVDRCYNLAKPPANLELSGKSCATGIPYPKELFQIVFIHELSHIIETGPNSRFDELKKILSTGQEDYLTNYSKNADKCYRTNKDDEDYAEMIAYFLNPEFPEQDLGPPDCKPSDETRTKNPYKTGRFPLHQKLAAEILGVSGPLTPAPVTELAKFSCPVRGGGPNILPSYQADTKDGHCGTDYNKKLSDPNDRCQGNTRRGKSIDIDTCQIPRSWEQVPPDYSTCGPNGKDVELPTIDGQRVDWQYVGDIPLTRKDCFDHEIVSGCGTGYIFKADLGGGKNWVLHLLHMGTTTIQPGETRPSGTIVGKTEAIHTHISIGKDVPDSDIKDQVKSYWKSADEEMKLCQ